MVVDSSFNIEVWQDFLEILDSLRGLVLVQSRKMPSGRCEDGVEKWRAATCPLGYDKSKMAFWVTEIELERVSMHFLSIDSLWTMQLKR